MTDLRLTDLDFDGIRANLKTFLQAQDEFTDYNFDGSGLSVLLDVLAYNTAYNAMLTHLLANEQFLDTAIKRASVVSLAKALGYVPQSTKSAIATVNIQVTPSGQASPTLDLPTTTIFTTSINGTNFNFSVQTAQTVAPSDGKFTFSNVNLIEGAQLAMTYVVTPDTVSGPFLIPNQSVDVSTVTVAVRDNITSTSTTFYTQASTVLDVLPTSNVYWIEERPDGNYQIVFGDGVLGNALVSGNVVSIGYISSSGSAANGAKLFTLSGDLGGATTVTLVSTAGAFGGAEREAIDSVRFRAPKFNATRDRAVTASDYKSLILSQFPQLNSVAVWGGEDNDPPIYGKVFISLEPLPNQVITPAVEDFIATSIIKPRSVVSIQPEFVDPEYLYIGIDVQSQYDLTQTTSNSAQIASFISTAIQNYFGTQLSRLDTTFYYSVLVRTIDSSTASIIGSLVSLRLQKRIVGTTTGSFETLNYNGALLPNSIRSSFFITTIGGIQYTAYIRDVPGATPPDPTGTGTLGLFAKDTDKVLDPNYGTIDYSTGKAIINNLIVTGYLGVAQDVRIGAVPQDSARNISPVINSTTDITVAAIYPLASKNTILKLDDSSEDTISAIKAGLTVVATPYVQSN